MICFNGDEVKLHSGETGEVIDTWGVARTWHKIKTKDGRIIFVMSENIESIVIRHSDKKKNIWRSAHGHNQQTRN